MCLTLTGPVPGWSHNTSKGYSLVEPNKLINNKCIWYLAAWDDDGALQFCKHTGLFAQVFMVVAFDQTAIPLCDMSFAAASPKSYT